MSKDLPNGMTMDELAKQTLARQHAMIESLERQLAAATQATAEATQRAEAAERERAILSEGCAQRGDEALQMRIERDVLAVRLTAAENEAKRWRNCQLSLAQLKEQCEKIIAMAPCINREVRGFAGDISKVIAVLLAQSEGEESQDGK
jgi:hypothetical protein